MGDSLRMESHSSTNSMRIGYETNDVQNEDGNTVFVSIDSYYWSRELGCWVPIVLYKHTHSVRTIDDWRTTLKSFSHPTLFIKKRII